MYNVLTRLMKFVMVDAARKSHCNMMIHHNCMKCTKKQLIQCTTHSQFHLQLPPSGSRVAAGWWLSAGRKD